MRIARSIITVGLAALTAGCATFGGGHTAGGADGVARLERARASRPNDPAVARSLGIAYFKASRLDDARQHLSAAARLDPRDGTASLYLGLTAEQQNDIPAAKAAYQSYVRYGRTSRVRRQLEARLAALTRRELQLAAKSAIAQEQQLATQQGGAKTVAVMPLRFVGQDSSLAPLERGLAELITTDLSRSAQLTVVERARLQALLDEMALQQSGQVDSTTTLRAGRILQAGRIVNGQILQNENYIRVDAAIVDVPTSQVAGGAANENTLEQIFAIERAIVLQLFDSLGVVLTTAERNALEQRPTRSLQAFLAYSRGLSLEDQGKYDEAARNYQEAYRLDPGFGEAQQKSSEVQAAAAGEQVSVATVETAIQGTIEGQIVAQAQQGQAVSTNAAVNSASAIATSLNPSQAGSATESGGSTGSNPEKDNTSNATGGEQAGGSANVRVVIKLPRP